MGYLFSNYATGRLAAELDAAENTVTLEDGGSLFPTVSGSDVAQAVLEDVNGNIEIVTITNHSIGSDVFTITRAQEGTIALTFPIGSVFELRVTKGILENLLQRSGGIMTGALDMDGNEVQNALIIEPTINGGVFTGVTLRDSAGATDTEIFIPLGGAPTIGGNEIFHAGNLTAASLGVVAETREVGTAANSGLAGGGDLSANRDLSMDLNNLVGLGEAPTYNDKLGVYDDSTAATKSVDAEYLFGILVRTLAANHVLERADSSRLMEFDSASNLTLTIPPNSSVAFPTNTLIIVRRRGTGTVQLVAGAGVTIESPSNYMSIGARYGMILLLKRATDTWAVEGRLST